MGQDVSLRYRTQLGSSAESSEGDTGGPNKGEEMQLNPKYEKCPKLSTPTSPVRSERALGCTSQPLFCPILTAGLKSLSASVSLLSPLSGFVGVVRTACPVNLCQKPSLMGLSFSVSVLFSSCHFTFCSYGPCSFQVHLSRVLVTWYLSPNEDS